MKKMLATAAALMLALTLSACSSEADPEPATATADTSVGTASEAPAADEATGHTVVYEVTGDGATASNITYMTMTGGNAGTEQANAAPIPFTKEIALEKTGMFEMNMFSLTAMSDDSGTTITCKITVDGEVMAEQTSTGPYALVSCAGS